MLLLEPGSVVIKFPLDGRVMDEVALSDDNEFMLYEVHSLDYDRSVIQLKITNEDLILINNPDLLHEQDLSEYLVILEKKMHQLIQEGVWWGRPD